MIDKFDKKTTIGILGALPMVLGAVLGSYLYDLSYNAKIALLLVWFLAATAGNYIVSTVQFSKEKLDWRVIRKNYKCTIFFTLFMVLIIVIVVALYLRYC